MLIAITAVVGTASASEERITNGDFSASSTQLTGWTPYTDGGNVARYYQYSKSCASLNIYGGYGTGTAKISQTVDLQGVTTLTFKYFVYQGYSPDDRNDIGGIEINGNRILTFNTGWNYDSSWSDTKTVAIDSQYRLSDATLSFVLKTGSSDSSGVYAFNITDISAMSIYSQPSVSSYTYTDANGNTVGIGNYGLNLAMSSDGSAYANITLDSYNTGGASVSECYIEFDRDGDGSADDVSGLGYTWFPAYFYSVNEYTPQFRYCNGYYKSQWYSLGTTVATRLKINTAGAYISASTGEVSIGASDIPYFTEWATAHYYWNFDYPSGTGSYIDDTTDTTIDFNYPNNATKKMYDIGMYAILENSTTSSNRVTIPTTTFEDAVDLRDNSVSFGSSSYTAGSTMTVNWDVSSWYSQYPTHTYTLQLWRSLSDGTKDYNYTSPSYTTTISPTSSTQSGTTYITAPNVASYYSVYILDSTSSLDVVHTSSPTSVIAYSDVIVQLLADSVTYTTATTLTLYVGETTDDSARYTRSGFTNPINNITTGSYTLSQLPYGGSSSTYTLKAETTGYSTITTTFSLPVTDNILRIDFVTGASEGSYTGGSGTAYASSFVTIRVIDEGTGAYQSGVSVSIEAKQATNPAEWFVNLFGSAWGSTIEGTVQFGITDSNGGVTFAVFPNYRYQVDLAYNNRTWQYTFQPSTVTTEEIIRLDITESITGKDKTDIITMDVSSSMDDNKGYIIVNFKDKTAKTTMLSIAVYQYTDGEASLATLVGTDNPIIITESSYGSKIDEYVQTLTINRASGKEYVVSLECVSETFGTNIPDDVIKRSKTVEFNGIRIPIGNIPDGLYIVICFVVLLMLGAVGTQVTSRFYAIVVAVVGIFMLWAGWMSALGTVGEIACIVAFILAILYYIATGNQPQ